MKSKDKERNRLSIQDLCLIAIFAALTAILAQIAIPLPFSPVPLSFGMVGVYFSGILLRTRCAVLSQICYLFLGAVGLPVFGLFRGGIGMLLGPTGGYLMVYPIMAGIVAATLNNSRAIQSRKTMIRGAIAICAAHLVLYLGGTIGYHHSGQYICGRLGLAVIPYIPLDIVKIVFCVGAGSPIRNRLL